MMQSSTGWLVLAFGLLILEMLTGTFYLLVFSVAAAIAAIAAYLGVSEIVQLLIAAVIGGGGVFVLRRSPYGKPQQADAQHDPNVNLDIGQSIQVDQWKPDRTARVMYRGAEWDVELTPEEPLASGQFTIVAVRGARLIVKKSAP